jgi:hypothetical protein
MIWQWMARHTRIRSWGEKWRALRRFGRFGIGVASIFVNGGSDKAKRRADLWRVRPLRLSGFVVVMLAGLKPRQVMAMADADQLGSELGDYRAAPGFCFPPCGGRRHAGQRAPVAPPVDMVEGVIMLF